MEFKRKRVQSKITIDYWRNVVKLRRNIAANKLHVLLWKICCCWKRAVSHVSITTGIYLASVLLEFITSFCRSCSTLLRLPSRATPFQVETVLQDFARRCETDIVFPGRFRLFLESALVIILEMQLKACLINKTPFWNTSATTRRYNDIHLRSVIHNLCDLG